MKTLRWREDMEDWSEQCARYYADEQDVVRDLILADLEIPMNFNIL